MVDWVTALAVFGISTEATKALADICVDSLKGALKDQGKKLLDWSKTEAEILGAVQKYAQNYTQRHGQLKVLGMTEPMSLAKIYTDVCFLDRDEIRLFADPAGLEALHREPERRRRLQSGDKRVDGLKLANERSYLMVLGQPGAGKSTFLRRIGLEALKGTQGRYQHALFPVLLELRRYPEGKLDLVEEIAKELETCGFPEPKDATRHFLQQGRLLLLLDGLDEVPSQHQNAVIDHIQDFVDRHANNRFIASCRTAAYHSRFRRFTDILMADFDDGQIQHFIGQWFLNERDYEAKTAERCWEALKAPENATAKELAQNPLLLTLLCLVFDDHQCFPRNRAVLYGEALDVLLKKWAAEKRINRDPIYKDLELPLEKIMLGQIAHDFFQADRLFFPRAEVSAAITGFLADNLNAPKHLDGDKVLREIEIQQGILVARDQSGGVLSFSHLTFQEYLTAQYLAQHDEWDELAWHGLTDDSWREVCLLTAGQALPNADNLLRAMAKKCHTLALSHSAIIELFRWAENNSNTSRGKIRPAIKRITLFLFALAFGRSRYPSLVFPLIKVYRFIRHLDVNFRFPLALEIGAVFNQPEIDQSTALSRVLLLMKELNRCDIFNVKIQVPDNPQGNPKDLAVLVQFKEISEQLGEALQLSDELFLICANNPTPIIECIDKYRLLLDCKAAALSVTPSAWAEIEAGLFLVDDPAPQTG